MKHKTSNLREIFEEFAEVDPDSEDEELVVTPIGFKKLCRKYKIYSLEAQKSFLESSKDRGMVSSIGSLVMGWKVVKPRIALQ